MEKFNMHNGQIGRQDLSKQLLSQAVTRRERVQGQKRIQTTKW